MVWTTAGAFQEFLSTINLPGDHRTIANIRKDWIVRLRSGGLNILDAFTMGSIPRYTALRDHADLDVMVVLHFAEHIKGRTPAQVLSSVKTSLGSGAGNVRRNGQAVTMKFLSWPSVDVVPASRLVDKAKAVTGYEIPDMNRGEWIRTNPPSHSVAITAAVGQYGPNFRHVVKMIKEWNRRQDVRMQSYHIEVIALKMTTSCQDHSWAILQWLETAKGAGDKPVAIPVWPEVPYLRLAPLPEHGQVRTSCRTESRRLG
ncbi:nucleotidyltransferase [Arthrobacter sp. ISL-5]|nr:nucleotidyltransferase [Arthrobacter sp. ISL-5]